jgi:hypothetical protein
MLHNDMFPSKGRPGPATGILVWADCFQLEQANPFTGIFRPLTKILSIRARKCYTLGVRKSASVTLTLVAAAAISARGQQPTVAKPVQQDCISSGTLAGGSGNPQKTQNCEIARGGFGHHCFLHHAGG